LEEKQTHTLKGFHDGVALVRHTNPEARCESFNGEGGQYLARVTWFHSRILALTNLDQSPSAGFLVSSSAAQRSRICVVASWFAFA